MDLIQYLRRLHAAHRRCHHMDLELAVPIASATVASAAVALPADPSIFAGFPLLGVCALGSVIGACVALGFWIPKRGHVEPAGRLLLKFGSSLGCGVFMTPGLLRWQHVPMIPDYIALASVVVAAFAVIVLHLALPLVEDYVSRLGERFSVAHPRAAEQWQKLTRPAELRDLTPPPPTTRSRGQHRDSRFPRER